MMLRPSTKRGRPTTAGVALLALMMFLPMPSASAHPPAIYHPYRWQTEYRECTLFIVLCHDATRDIQHSTVGAGWTEPAKSAAIVAAQTQWNSVATVDYFKFAFQGQSSKDPDCTQNGFNQNVHSWENIDGVPASGDDTLAVTWMWIQADDVSMYCFGVEYDSLNTWHFGASPVVPNADTIDFQSVVTHELGHGGGFLHLEEGSTECPPDYANPTRHTMCEYYGVSPTLEAYERTLEPHDKDTHQMAYGGIPA